LISGIACRNCSLGEGKGILISEVSSFQECFREGFYILFTG
jgi:hypothetical protein